MLISDEYTLLAITLTVSLARNTPLLVSPGQSACVYIWLVILWTKAQHEDMMQGRIADANDSGIWMSCFVCAGNSMFVTSRRAAELIWLSSRYTGRFFLFSFLFPLADWFSSQNDELHSDCKTKSEL